jgi:SNF2 family DNA or RNA helicase
MVFGVPMKPATAVRKSLEPWIPDTVEYFWWQVPAIRKCCRMRSFLLADEMGLGKSMEALTVFAVDVVLGKSEKCVIVCPATLKDNWADEIEKFTRFPYIVLGQETDHRGRTKSLPPMARDRQLVEFATMGGPRILITNYEQLDPHLRTLNTFFFDVAIFDEAHYMKNPKAKRTKAALRLKATRSFVLTGSPMLNQVDELWSLLHRIDPGRYPKYWPFVMRYAVFGGYNDKQIIGVKNEKELRKRVDELMVRRLAKDTLGLDAPQIIERTVSLHPEQRKLYDEIVKDMRLTVPGDPEPQDIQNALTKFLKLKQICGTTATVLGMGQDHSFKLDLAIQDDLGLLFAGEKIVVFTQFRGVIEAYHRRLEAAFATNKVDIPIFELHGDIPMGQRIPTVKTWSLTEGPAVIICNPTVAGVGLNMVAACHASFLDKLFVPKLNEQAIARLSRLGQTRPVQIREYRVKGTIETRIEAILKKKDSTFRSIIESGDYKKLLYLVMRDEEEEDAA